MSSKYISQRSHIKEIQPYLQPGAYLLPWHHKHTEAWTYLALFYKNFM